MNIKKIITDVLSIYGIQNGGFRSENKGDSQEHQITVKQTLHEVEGVPHGVKPPVVHHVVDGQKADNQKQNSK